LLWLLWLACQGGGAPPLAGNAGAVHWRRTARGVALAATAWLRRRWLTWCAAVRVAAAAAAAARGVLTAGAPHAPRRRPDGRRTAHRLIGRGRLRIACDRPMPPMPPAATAARRPPPPPPQQTASRSTRRSAGSGGSSRWRRSYWSRSARPERSTRAASTALRSGVCSSTTSRSLSGRGRSSRRAASPKLPAAAEERDRADSNRQAAYCTVSLSLSLSLS
jgi:hypothetical protein